MEPMDTMDHDLSAIRRAVSDCSLKDVTYRRNINNAKDLKIPAEAPGIINAFRGFFGMPISQKKTKKYLPEKLARRFILHELVNVPACYDDERDYRQDHFDYFINKQMPSNDGELRMNEMMYYKSVNYMWNVFVFRKRLTESFFLAVHLFDAVVRKHSISYEEEELGCLVIACVNVACKADSHAPIMHYFTDTYSGPIIKRFETVALAAVKFNVTSHHAMHFVRILSAMIADLILEEKMCGVTYEMVKVLAFHCMSTPLLVNTLPSLLAATLMRIVFAMQKVKLDDAHDICLQHSRVECRPIAIMILDHFSFIRKNTKKNEMFAYWSARGYNIARMGFARAIDYFMIHDVVKL